MNDKAAHTHVEGHAHAILSWSDDSAHDIEETGRYPLMTEAIRQILVEKGIISAGCARLGSFSEVVCNSFRSPVQLQRWCTIACGRRRSACRMARRRSNHRHDACSALAR